MKTWRIGIIGFAHSHITTNALSFHALGERVQWIACADVIPRTPSLTDQRGTRNGCLKELVEKCGIPKVYESYEEMLKENEFDIMLVCSENEDHARVSEACLRRGIHVVLEKPFSTSMQGAFRMVRAAEEGNAQIITNWPITWSPGMRLTHELVARGEIGKLFKVTWRNSDSKGALSYGQVMTGPEKGREWWHQSTAGGGSMLDYCCYGACLSCWFFDQKPLAAYGLKANFESLYGDAEDYATITARFPQGVALLEGSWTTLNSGGPNALFFGFDGTIAAEHDKVLVYKTRHKETPDAIYEPEPLSSERDTLGKEVLRYLETGNELHPTLGLPLNLAAMSILDAGIRSARSGKEELITDRTWTIG